ncbi:hypothetical protein GCM10022226_62010 [Sphaerisporangium flaviroseum]|uniref:Uncharacterized protein n=1 Tax=Sphaerisporangium flaviroseum TaxID=509199 RepID=A0ABP7J2L2_9ACTN
MIHYLNLSRGLLCAPHVEQPRFLRLQSTWCEQKRWADVLWTLSPDFYYTLAIGQALTVHDVSERPRVTRACWQGLAWVRFACARLWGTDRGPAPGRSGMDMSPYFTRELNALDRRVCRYVTYFGQFHAGRPLDIQLCHGVALRRALADSEPGPAVSEASQPVPRRGSADLAGAARFRREVTR